MEISIFGTKLNLELLIFICVLFILVNVVCGCTRCTAHGCNKEGFSASAINSNLPSPYSLNSDESINTNLWNMPDMKIQPGQQPSKGASDVLNRPSQPVPLPDGEMLLFSNTEFKPECCPNTYSTSTGCACMTVDQYDYLNNRGGNNEPYSEY